MKRNTPALWNALWNQAVPKEEDIFGLHKEAAGIRWQRLEKIVLGHFGKINNLEVIEVGAGAGTNAALFAKRGAKVTILDYSPLALKRSREFFRRNKLTAKFVQADALQLPQKLHSKFDVVMSFGLTEHFLGPKRVAINQAHLDLLKKGGLFFISVPNKYNPPYRIFKFLAEKAGYWKVGEEFPYSRGELEDICAKIGVTKFGFFGDSFWESFNFLNPFLIMDKIKGSKRKHDLGTITRQEGSFLDEYLSYATVLYGTKG